MCRFIISTSIALTLPVLMFAQNPANFENGIKLSTSTQQDAVPRVPVMDAQGIINGYILKSSLELSLGNPTTDGQILSSTVSGVRSWINAPTGGSGILPLQFLKANVRRATTGNITLFGEQIIDGQQSFSGDRVLVKDQTNAAENGIYNVSTGAWTRSGDVDSDIELARTLVYVRGGAVNFDTFFQTPNNETTNLGTTDVIFEEVDLYTQEGHVIQDNGTDETQRSKLNFTGTGVTVTDDSANDRTTVNITGGGSGDFLSDGTVPMAGTLNMSNHNISNVDNILPANFASEIGSPTQYIGQIHANDYFIASGQTSILNWEINNLGVNGTLFFRRQSAVSSSIYNPLYSLNETGTPANNSDLTNKAYVDGVVGTGQEGTTGIQVLAGVGNLYTVGSVSYSWERNGDIVAYYIQVNNVVGNNLSGNISVRTAGAGFPQIDASRSPFGNVIVTAGTGLPEFQSILAVPIQGPAAWNFAVKLPANTNTNSSLLTGDTRNLNVTMTLTGTYVVQ